MILYVHYAMILLWGKGMVNKMKLLVIIGVILSNLGVWIVVYGAFENNYKTKKIITIGSVIAILGMVFFASGYYIK